MKKQVRIALALSLTAEIKVLKILVRQSKKDFNFFLSKGSALEKGFSFIEKNLKECEEQIDNLFSKPEITNEYVLGLIKKLRDQKEDAAVALLSDDALKQNSEKATLSGSTAVKSAPSVYGAAEATALKAISKKVSGNFSVYLKLKEGLIERLE